MNQIIRPLFIIILVIFLGTGFVRAAEESESTTETSQPEGFNPGKFVIEHVSDAFEWHIATFGETEISIPLPIILYSSDKGWNFFMSSRFHHGKETFNGFRIEHKGKNEGKIVEVNEQGEVIGLPVDLSITKTVAGIFVSVIVLLFIFLNIAKTAKRRVNKAPAGMQSLFEPVILFVRDDVAKPAIGEKKYERFMPFLLTLFFFILINNLLGLIPIFPFGSNVTGNIAVTMVLALFTFLITTFSTNKHYWKEIYNPDVPWWLKFPIPLMPIVELTGVITKPFVLMVRLFANMLAGHLIVTVFVSLIFIFNVKMGVEAGLGVSVLSVAFSVFILLLDVLVSFIQAYVFTLLSALYFGMASPEHH
ncbi:MAG: F0F1 ATP synthase subunit A [Prolixibacteraceae bacterium]|nr:F0F1 ATP synthase subunit A [Prolixibacteraceae bacterium]